MSATTYSTGTFNQAEQTSTNSGRTIARIAGILYLVIIIGGIFAQFMVRESLIIPGDAVATTANIIESESLFRMGIVGDLIMIMSDIAIGLFFYVLMKPVNNTLALLAAFFRLAQAATLGVNLINLMSVANLAGNDSMLTALGADSYNAQVMLSLQAHTAGYAIAMIFFAFSITILGYLVYKSGYLPKILGILLIIASAGYLVDSFAQVLLVNYADYAELFGTIVFGPAFIAELAFALWLLIKGVRSTANA